MNSKTQRQRGFIFEYDTVNKINGFMIPLVYNPTGETRFLTYHAARAGGASIDKPDVMATAVMKDYYGLAMAFECKETQESNRAIPFEQIVRCYDILNTLFSYYDDKFIVLAFKFLRNKKIGRKQSQYRYVVLANPGREIFLYSKDIEYFSYSLTTESFIVQSIDDKIVFPYQIYNKFRIYKDIHEVIDYTAGFVRRVKNPQ